MENFTESFKQDTEIGFRNKQGAHQLPRPIILSKQNEKKLNKDLKNI